jgi:dipeptidyl aminopeptidase/acylaminoacyl peptidase
VSPVAAYGRWDSPLGVAAVAAQRVSRYSLASDGTALFWLEGRPEEAGRVVLVRSVLGGSPAVVSPPGTSIRSRVHEYGGGAWCLLGASAGHRFAYVEERSQRVYLVTEGGEPVALTPEAPAGERWHHGGLVAGPAGSVLVVRERLFDGGVERSVVLLEAGSPGRESALCAGRDFFASPVPSPDGAQLAWVAWDHPDMPWDATELWVGALRTDGAGWAVLDAVSVGAHRLAGSSVDQPVWLDAHTLAFVADAEGWWQPWRCRIGEDPVRLDDLDAEFQGPAWGLGQHTLVTLGHNQLACVWRRDGVDHVGTLAVGGARTELEQPCVAATSLCAHETGVAWLGQTPAAPGGVWWIPLVPGGDGDPAAVQVSGRPSPLETDDVSVAVAVSVETAGGRPVHANFYPPRRFGWRGPDGAAPPLIVHCHGGPTASADAGFDPMVQMFTTRGYAVATVNFAGSTGYGRDYRRALDGQWGVADVDDCVEVARWLAEGGRVDGQRMAIRGGSAGGLTALGALVRSDVFAAAVSWYGVTDLLSLAATTHDFESRYTDRLVGPLPEAAARYEERSPLNQVGEITGAVLLLQGEDDPVVPADQTRRMAAALARRGVVCEAQYFAGESHGFRRAETLIACFEAELAFYERVLLSG